MGPIKARVASKRFAERHENTVELGFKRAVIWIAHHNGFHVVGPWHLCPWPVADPEKLECDILCEGKADLFVDMDWSPKWHPPEGPLE